MNIILDTNIVVSLFLFRGNASNLYNIIKTQAFKAYISPSILDEYQRVFAYKKFGLSSVDVHYLIHEEILKYFILVKEPPAIQNWIPLDKSDNKFIDLACSIPRSILVSGDAHILDLKNSLPCRTLSLSEFLDVLS